MWKALRLTIKFKSNRILNSVHCIHIQINLKKSFAIIQRHNLWAISSPKDLSQFQDVVGSESTGDSHTQGNKFESSGVAEIHSVLLAPEKPAGPSQGTLNDMLKDPFHLCCSHPGQSWLLALQPFPDIPRRTVCYCSTQVQFHNGASLSSLLTRAYAKRKLKKAGANNRFEKWLCLYSLYKSVLVLFSRVCI